MLRVLTDLRPLLPELGLPWISRHLAIVSFVEQQQLVDLDKDFDNAIGHSVVDLDRPSGRSLAERPWRLVCLRLNDQAPRCRDEPPRSHVHRSYTGRNL